MNGEGRLPTTLVVSIVIIIAAVGVAAYFAGRYGRGTRARTVDRIELPDPAPPAPALVETVATPADIPPTVTPPSRVVIEKTTRPSRGLVERSSQIVVPVGPAPTARPASVPVDLGQPTPAGKRIVVEVRPTPTPTVPEIELRPPPPPVETPIPPPPPELPPEETPEPEPEPEPTARPAIPRRSQADPRGRMESRSFDRGSFEPTFSIDPRSS
jgi:fused signal recognition particle receptor